MRLLNFEITEWTRTTKNTNHRQTNGSMEPTTFGPSPLASMRIFLGGKSATEPQSITLFVILRVFKTALHKEYLVYRAKLQRKLNLLCSFDIPGWLFVACMIREWGNNCKQGFAFMALLVALELWLFYILNYSFLSQILGWPVWFRMQDQNSPAVTLLTEEDKSLGKKKIQVTDLVLGVRTTMPCLKEEWVKEKQNTTKWLTQAQLEKLRGTRCDYTRCRLWGRVYCYQLGNIILVLLKLLLFRYHNET